MKPIYLIILFPIFFIGFWFFVLATISYIGGWRRLSQDYKATKAPTGLKFSSESISLKLFTNYNRCLSIYSSPEGIYITPWLILRFMHPTLFIPWTEMYNPRSSSLLWVKFTKVEIGSPKKITMKLSRQVYESKELAT